MAPEVAAGQPYDVSSDIYGLGMVLCRILEFASVIYDIVYDLVIEKCVDRPPTPPRHCIVSHSNSLPLTVRC
jgi:serine/threonine protein kinase